MILHAPSFCSYEYVLNPESRKEWSSHENNHLLAAVKKHGTDNWELVAVRTALLYDVAPSLLLSLHNSAVFLRREILLSFTFQLLAFSFFGLHARLVLLMH